LLAIDAAGLVDALTGNDKLTVFAPTDEAFAKLPQATLDELAAKPRKLRRVLKYHVVGRELKAADVAERDPDSNRGHHDFQSWTRTALTNQWVASWWRSTAISPEFALFAL